MKYDNAVFIGRFQPFHNGHLKVIEKALKIADRLVIVIGSCKSPLSLRNPFSLQTRIDIIINTLTQKQRDRIDFVSVEDSAYNFECWLLDVKKAITYKIPPHSKVVLVGNYKDDTSYYLDYFPEWDTDAESISDKNCTSATEIRTALYEGTPEKIKNKVSEYFYIQFATMCFKRDSTYYGPLFEEYDFIKKYKKAWESAPYPPVFVTTDAIAFCMGHVLLIERKFNPGKGKYALPGGFINQEENIFDCCLRELTEETKLDIGYKQLKSSLKEVKVFDHPRRDPRGRVITHGHFFRIDEKKLPMIKGGDDAAKAFWFPLQDLQNHEQNFYSDHCQIVKYFMNRGN